MTHRSQQAQRRWRGRGPWLWLVALFLLITDPVSAQDAPNARANILLSRTIRMYDKLQDAAPADRAFIARQVLKQLERIARDHPDSLPGARIRGGGLVGPIDMEALRVLAEGGTLPERPLPAWVTAMLGEEATRGRFGHGAFPARGPRTHAGLDLRAPCDSPVRLPVAGRVLRFKPGGRNGGVVILEPWPAEQRATQMAFTGLQDVQIDRIGPLAAGQVLGKVGPLPADADDADADADAGATAQCGLQVEIRHFTPPDRTTHPLWTGLDMVGDWRRDRAFLTSWSAPEPWFAAHARLADHGTDTALTLARGEGMSLAAPPVPPAPGEDRQTLHLSPGGPLTGQAQVLLRREGGRLKLTVEGLDLRLTGDAPPEAPPLLLRLTLPDLCAGCAPAWQLAQPSGMRLSAPGLTAPLRPVTFALPADRAARTGVARLALISANDGARVAGFTTPIALRPARALGPSSLPSNDEARAVLQGWAPCLTPLIPTKGRARFLLTLDEAGQVDPRRLELKTSGGLSAPVAAALTQDLPGALARCAEATQALPGAKFPGWRRLQLTLGAEE